ncbi:helix-turn-helix protein [Kerstersia gyiorum]|uniref:Helix-turn-helix protein n=1 Tax=Kerstersia gyiorum TaxID=206506 RepID=A0A4Q7MVU6_9BURK|nr:helix-turn-helix domain-containing protein [Kerstersia gyiorum]KAB0544170.1 transcriptional regulator [Kerstersia gyiorum]RZS73152.1 helix-turn-helix protein [Kerstersia gyiorum]
MRNQKSSASESQRQRIIKALLLRPHTSYELRKLGCYQCPTRISELRRLGFNISTERVSIWDDEGFPHDGIALYTLKR